MAPKGNRGSLHIRKFQNVGSATSEKTKAILLTNYQDFFLKRVLGNHYIKRQGNLFRLGLSYWSQLHSGVHPCTMNYLSAEPGPPAPLPCFPCLLESLKHLRLNLLRSELLISNPRALLPAISTAEAGGLDRMGLCLLCLSGWRTPASLEPRSQTGFEFISSSPAVSEVATSAALASLLAHHSLATMQIPLIPFPSFPFILSPSLPLSLLLKDRVLLCCPGGLLCIAGIKQTLETCVGNLKFKGSFQTGEQSLSVLKTSALMTSALMTSTHHPGSSCSRAPLPLCALSTSLLQCHLRTGDSWHHVRIAVRSVWAFPMSFLS